MRVSAVILAAILGSSAALAQGDQRDRIGPIAEPAPAAKPDPKAKADPKAMPNPKSMSARNAVAAKPKPDAEKNDEPAAAKPETRSAAATTGSAAAGVTSAKPSGLQDVYAAIPRADRIAIQNDLTWGGDFSGPIDGEFSERLVAAVKGYQARLKNPATGIISAEERAALAAAVAPRKQEVG